MLPIEGQVGGQQTLLGRVQGIAAAAEIEQEPAQVQHGHRLLQIHAEEPAGRDILGRRHRDTLVAAEGCQGKHGEVLALDQADPDRGLTGTLPRHARLRIAPLGEIDQLEEIVALLGIDGHPFRGLQHIRVLLQRGRPPGRARVRRHLPPQALRQVVCGPRRRPRIGAPLLRHRRIGGPH